MDRLILVFLAVALGGGAGYLASEYYRSEPVVFASGNIAEPDPRNELITTRVVSSNTAVVMYPDTNINGAANNAAIMQSWTIRANIGVDFTTMNWGDIDGIGESIPETGTISISGELPPLKVLDGGFQLVKEMTDAFLINEIAEIDEDEVLRPQLLEIRKELARCLEDAALYRTDTMTHAKEVVVSWLAAAMPTREDGTQIATFDLKFENEMELSERISELQDQPIACESSLMLQKQD